MTSSVAVLLSAALAASAALAPRVEAGFWEERRASAAANPEAGPVAALAEILPWGGKVLHGYGLPTADTRAAVTPRTAGHKPMPRWLTGLLTPFAEVEDFHLAGKPGPLILLIQNIHGLAEAQRNTSQLLARVSERYDLRLVGLEGASGPFATGAWRRAAPAEHISFTADFLLGERLIGGAEHFGLTAPEAPLLWGVETESSYLANIAAYRGTVPLRDAVRAYEARLGQALAEVKARVFSDALKALDARGEAYASRALGLGEYLAALAAVPGVSAARYPETAAFLAAYAAEKRIDFARAEAERARAVEALARALPPAELRALLDLSLAHRAGRVSFGDYHGALRALAARRGVDLSRMPALSAYIAYALLADRVRRDALFDEIAALETEAGDRLAVTAEEKEAVSLVRDARLLAKLFHQQMTPQDWAAWNARRPAALRVNDRLATFGLDLPVLGFPADLSLFEAFYAEAFGRNADLLSNLLAKGAAAPAAAPGRTPVWALVSGGFHTAGLRELLVKKGLSFAVLTPRLQSVDGAGDYLAAFSRPRTPLEAMMGGTSVFLQTYRGTTEKPTPGGEHVRRAVAGAAAVLLAALAAAPGVAAAAPADPAALAARVDGLGAIVDAELVSAEDVPGGLDLTLSISGAAAPVGVSLSRNGVVDAAAPVSAVLPGRVGMSARPRPPARLVRILRWTRGAARDALEKGAAPAGAALSRAPVALAGMSTEGLKLAALSALFVYLRALDRRRPRPSAPGPRDPSALAGFGARAFLKETAAAAELAGLKLAWSVLAAAEAAVSPAAGKLLLEPRPGADAEVAGRLADLMPPFSRLQDVFGVPPALKDAMAVEVGVATARDALEWFAFFEGDPLPGGALTDAQAALLERSAAAYQTAAGLRDLMARFRRLREADPAAAGLNFGAHAARVLSAAARDARSGALSPAALQSLIGSLLLQREVGSGRESEPAHRDALLTLVKAAAARLADARPARLDWLGLPAGWAAFADAGLPTVHLQVLTPEPAGDPRTLENLARSLAAAARRGESVAFVSAMPAAQARALALRLTARVRALTLLHDLPERGMESVERMGERVMTPEETGGLLTPLGLIDAGRAVRAVAGRAGLAGDFNVFFSTPDLDLLDRSTVTGDLRRRVQFLILDLLKGTVAQALSHTEDALKAIQLLNYQA